MQFPNLSQNYFELFGLQPEFELDVGRLDAEQRRLQATYHPDRFVTASDRERRMSVQMAAWINQAYATLCDPVKRSQYLLEINGVVMPDESTTTSDSAFLMEQIELREEVEACRHDDDGIARSERIASRLQQRAAELARDYVDRFDAGDLQAALTVSRKMQFIQRIQQQLAELQFELEEY